MTAVDIIKKYLNYVEYDPEQTFFNVMNGSYYVHESCQNIRELLKYEPEGNIAVLYAKNFFRNRMKEGKISVLSLLQDPECLSEEFAMWDMFHSEKVRQIEETVLNTYYGLTKQIIPHDLIGTPNKDKDLDILLGACSSVADELHRCNVDLFRQGGPMQPVSHFSTHVHVTNRLSECLMALEASQDGIYLCYIRANDSADGYFSYFLKSNGNILSINERIDEAYPGAHKNSRNGRWSEGKQFELFPYSLISHMTEDAAGNKKCRTDYKGYVQDYFIDEEKLAFHNLPQESYMSIVIAMMLLNLRYGSSDLQDMQLKFVDSMLPVNLSLPCPGEQALIVPGDSAIALAHKELTFDFTREDVMQGAYGEKFNRSGENKDYREIGCFMTGRSIFVDLYGKGFQLNTAKLLEADTHIKYITGGTISVATPNAEFVGTKRRMEMIAYMNARQQLTDHIREQMFQEYKDFGGTPAVREWWEKTLPKYKDKVLDLCLEYASNPNASFDSHAPLSIQMEKTKEIPYRTVDGESIGATPFNYRCLTPAGYPSAKTLCCITGAEASIYFTFNISDWGGICKIVGEENVPKIVKGYCKSSCRFIGNPILDATDPVATIGTPFERREVLLNNRYWDSNKWNDYYFKNANNDPDWISRKPPKTALPYNPRMGFSFVISFSKRGWAKLQKERGK